MDRVIAVPDPVNFNYDESMVMNPSLPQPETIPPVWKERRAPEAVRFCNWPLASGDPFAWLACGIAISTLFLLGWRFGSIPAPLCAAIALACSLWRCYLPVYWEFALGGVSQTILGWKWRIPWIAICKYELQANGVWLFADRSASPLHGVFIYYAGNKDQILAHLQYYLGAWTSTGDTSTVTLQVKADE